MSTEDVQRAVREAHTSQRLWAALTAKVTSQSLLYNYRYIV